MQDVIWTYIGGLEGAFYVRSIWVFFPGGNVYLPYLRYSFAYVILAPWVIGEYVIALLPHK